MVHRRLPRWRGVLVCLVFVVSLGAGTPGGFAEGNGNGVELFPGAESIRDCQTAMPPIQEMSWGTLTADHSCSGYPESFCGWNF